ncbi:MAG TPA: imelysin family protein, partial [Cytophagales bacterium]|nr:imelysin family protein [Cytophagales bacterium]
PTEAKFANLKVLYTKARVPYEQTEPLRAANGPIDTGADAVEGRLNAWPLSENYVDYVKGPEGDSLTGIINDTVQFPDITKEVLVANHESGGESNLTLGYHVIEFLLWGQDLNPDSARNSAGQRKYTDYTTKVNHERRKAYLKAATDILVQDLAYLVDQWRTGGTYRTKFLAQSDAENLSNAFSGIAWFCAGELPTERMFKAVQNADQEEEHSCFSDLTDRDIKLSMLGVSNLLNGHYNPDEQLPNKGLLKVLQARNPQGAQQVIDLFSIAYSDCEKIPAPFDQAIINESATVVKAKNSIIAFSNKLQEVCTSVGITMNIPE